MVLEKLKQLRGIFYRKLLKEGGGHEEPLPGFMIENTNRIVELPDAGDITKLDVTYPLLEPFSYAHIQWNDEEKTLIYNVIEPVLNDEEKKLLAKVSEAVIQLVEVGLTALRERSKAIEYLQRQVDKVLKDFGIQLTHDQYVKIMYFVYRNFLGYNEIDGLMLDPNIEDISCDGVNTPVFVVHRKYSSIKTTASFENVENLREFIIKLAERGGRYVSYAEPILDSTLPDGSRVSATIAGDVATRGPTFTIRKFGDRPLSPIEQILSHTTNSEILAYFWHLVEYGANMLFVGATATGKTTFLNSVCMFIPPERKVVTIEDTREIRIPHEHWVSGLARIGFGIPDSSGQKYGEVTMFDLLRESFRQNPDYVIVGETRGKEAYVMFQGMSSGHTSFSTFHANSVDAVIKRLTSPPIELSPTLIESLNVIAIMTHTSMKSERRVKEVVEIISVDPRTEEVKTNLVFLWNPATDTFEKVNDSQIIPRLVEARGGDAESAKKDLERRKLVLDWLKSKDIKDYLEVVRYVNMFYKEPGKLFETIGNVEFKPDEVKKEVKVEVPTVQAETPIAEIEQPVAPAISAAPAEPAPIEAPREEIKVEVPRIRRKRTSILELLGMPVIRESH
ncbi:MAG: type II/IV secretion system ATPase subunit [Candidatus Aenigmarchaeota archaeon]|nr:type II/IV secretion system ATPase subunit [Candidatus Aenigmarchaeota archaeon]